jgi:DNA (cytosine-5)-methyltransferase 3A
MSCGRIVLERAGIHVDNYYSSEVDRFAIQVADANWSQDTDKRLGDVRGVFAKDLPKIDLIIGGSPCQGFSFAGKQLNFEDERSKLFFEYVRILKECNPKYFLLENVIMGKEHENVISRLLDCYPVQINSALVSAQNRDRLYWTNIPGDGYDLFNTGLIAQPADNGILLKDIIDDENMIGAIKVDGEYHIRDKKCMCLDANYHKGIDNHGQRTLLIQVGTADGIKGHDLMTRVYSDIGKHPTLNVGSGGHQYGKIAVNDYEWRRLTPVECERLQTVPDNYTEGVSNTQRYKMLGNGWTVDVIAHIFKGIIFT